MSVKQLFDLTGKVAIITGGSRKVLAPADYLPPKTAFANGMLPNADILVAIGVAPGEMTASGYRLYLFYP